MTTARGELQLSGRRALLAVLVLTASYAVLDVLVGVQHSAQDAVLLWSGVLGLAWQALLVLLVRRCRWWAWVVGAAWSAISAVAAVAMVVDPVGVGGYDADVPARFVLLQAGLLVAAAGLWFAPGVRPGGSHGHARRDRRGARPPGCGDIDAPSLGCARRGGLRLPARR